MVRLRILLGLFLLVCIPAAVSAQGYTQDMQNGAVDWANQLITSTGVGAPNVNLPLPQQRAGALRAAKLDALRNLIETVKGINLNSETLVENSIVSNDQIRTRVEGAVKGFRVTDTKYMSSGDVEVTVEVPLSGIADAVLPATFGGGALLTGGALFCPTCGQPWPAGKAVPSGVALAGGESSMDMGGGAVTGLVIDARGLGLRPAMAPKVVDEKGEEVYGSKYVSRDYAVDIGMVGYEKDVQRAAKNERVAKTPLVVKGLSASGPNKTDVVVSLADAQKIHGAAAAGNFLQQCKVMFVLD
jgi:hypothetical protein